MEARRSGCRNCQRLEHRGRGVGASLGCGVGADRRIGRAIGRGAQGFIHVVEAAVGVERPVRASAPAGSRDFRGTCDRRFRRIRLIASGCTSGPSPESTGGRYAMNSASCSKWSCVPCRLPADRLWNFAILVMTYSSFPRSTETRYVKKVSLLGDQKSAV